MSPEGDRIAAAVQGRSFDAFAPDYDRYRPGYPDALFELLAERFELPPAAAVADLGAGTGRASIAMARRGWRVAAVEPGEGMRSALAVAAARAGVEVHVVAASAESTGLEGGSVDLVTAAQSFHWFDAVKAVSEMARILRPRGGAAAFWNVRDDDASPFLAAYTDLLHRRIPAELLQRQVPERESRTPRDLASGGLFEVDERVELHHEVRMTGADFEGLAFTASYLRLGLDDADEAGFRDELRSLITTYGVDGELTVPYRLDLWTARRVI